MPAWFALVLTLTSTAAFAVSKQDIQVCQSLGNQKKTAQCVAALKNNRVRSTLIECSKTLQCWSKQYRPMAQFNCDNAFRRAAASSPQWQKVWHGQSLSNADWLSRKAGTLIYYADKSGIRLECRFNPRNPVKVKIRYMESRN